MMSSVALNGVRRLGRMKRSSTSLFVCDIQERFKPLISHSAGIIGTTKTLLGAAKLMELPTLFTEQNPAKLGKTVPELLIPKEAKLVEKMKFSMLVPEVEEFLKQWKTQSIILVGIEAHVCVLQTTLDLLEQGFDVHVIADGVSSQRESDRRFAFERMRQSGAFVTTMEGALFQLMESAESNNFRDIQNLLKRREVVPSFD